MNREDLIAAVAKVVRENTCCSGLCAESTSQRTALALSDAGLLATVTETKFIWESNETNEHRAKPLHLRRTVQSGCTCGWLGGVYRKDAWDAAYREWNDHVNISRRGHK